MRKISYLFIFLLGLISCNQVEKKEDLSNKYINNIAETSDFIYYLISNEKNSLWEIYLKDANELKESIKVVFKLLEENKKITSNILDNKTINNELINYLPKNFEKLSLNYKKIVILNFKQKEMNNILDMCLNSSFHYFAVQTIIKQNRDTVDIGELFSAKLFQRATTFRDSIFITINGKDTFIGLDTNGSVIFNKIEETSGEKIYRGYFKNTLLGTADNSFEIKYYVK